jgi:PrtD family type I secretion system ABC transporter
MNRALPAAVRHPAVAAALKDCRRAFWSVAVFSGAVNILMFAGPLYMLQVYDRVLASRSVPTLVALSVALVLAFSFQGVMDLLRTRVIVRGARLLDQHLGTVVHDALIRLALNPRQAAEAHQPIRDLDIIRTFLTGAGPIALVDLPWMPVFLFICYLIHPLVGLMSLGGALLLLFVTFWTDRATREPSRELTRGASQRQAAAETTRRNSETITALGLRKVLAGRWTSLNEQYLGAVEKSSDVASSYGTLSKVLRMVLQSGILGLGAYLVIRQEMTAGAMIAASIMMSRALAPVETAIANWRAFAAARTSISRLSYTLAQLETPEPLTDLPKPHRSLDVERVAVAPPQAERALLQNIGFRLVAGEALGVIGPSGSGKTSLIRVLLGIWPPARGTVRIDGAALAQWSPETLGPHIGYVSQMVELFDGTIAENIARMTADPDADSVVTAAQAAGAHDLILRLPQGYDTQIGDSGAVLSAGQRQRIALARALFGEPFLIVLDEPNANLDMEGEAALLKAISDAKARGAIVIVIAHRGAMLRVCDKLLVVREGTQQAFGPRDEVLKSLAPPPQPARPAAGQPFSTTSMGTSLKIVSGARADTGNEKQ